MINLGDLSVLRQLATMMRDENIAHLSVGDLDISMMPPAPVTKTEPAPPPVVEAKPKEPNPIGPDGQPMSDEDMILYAHTLGDG